VLVRDLDRAEAFYAGVIGLPVQRRWTDDAGSPRSVWLALGGGAFLAIERASGAGATPEPTDTGWHCVALAISREEREAFRARLAAAGSKVERESPFTLYVRDPENNLLALSHYPDPAGPGGMGGLPPS
jgi:catechol 2,3-dioxygenase-like lactoylglutathione lyase family enzyme